MDNRRVGNLLVADETGKCTDNTWVIKQSDQSGFIEINQNLR
jgi:hypothetical protein